MTGRMIPWYEREHTDRMFAPLRLTETPARSLDLGEAGFRVRCVSDGGRVVRETLGGMDTT